MLPEKLRMATRKRTPSICQSRRNEMHNASRLPKNSSSQSHKWDDCTMNSNARAFNSKRYFHLISHECTASARTLCAVVIRCVWRVFRVIIYLFYWIWLAWAAVAGAAAAVVAVVVSLPFRWCILPGFLISITCVFSPPYAAPSILAYCQVISYMAAYTSMSRAPRYLRQHHDFSIDHIDGLDGFAYRFDLSGSQ